MTQKVLLVDCQVLQSGAKHRGMGKYSFELLKNIGSTDNASVFEEYVFIFNSNLETDEAIEQELLKSVKNSRVEYLDLKLAHNLFDTRKIRIKNEKILSKYVRDNKYETSSFLILSLFLYEICPAFPVQSQKFLLFYDLIPLLYFERYEASEISYPQNYLERFNIVFQADKIFTISKTVANDMSIFLGVPNNTLQNIDGSSIKRAHLKLRRPKIFKEGKNKKFILMPSGEDLRKNNEIGVKSFDIFNKKHNSEYSLIITSTFSDQTKQDLKKLSDNLIFSDNVDEEELAWLYDKCSCVYFPTEYEGLGLPILEAIDYGKPIACSSIPVFNEISQEAFINFDPHNPQDIALALGRAINHKPETQKYEFIQNKYTWSNSAKGLLLGMHTAATSTINEDRPSVAILCPDPRGYSAIGKVVAESHYELSKKFKIDYYFEVGKNHKVVRTTHLTAVARCFDVSEFDKQTHSKYDNVIYHVGNSEYHSQTTQKALGFGGVVIVHDTNLRGLYDFMLDNNLLTKERYDAELGLEKSLGMNSKSMITSIVNNKKLVLSHSQYAKKTIQDHIFTKTQNEYINLPVATSKFEKILQKNKTYNVGIAGIIAEVKGVNLLKRLIEDSRFESCNFFVIGHTFLGEKNTSWLNYQDRIRLIGDPTDIDFQSYISNLDILINIRKKYNGETSLSTLEAMRHGVVPIVRKIGWYDELPDSVCVKLKDESELNENLARLIEDPEIIINLSGNAQKLTSEEYSHSRYASILAELLNGSP